MAQSSLDALRHFIARRMRMSHIYQPLMLKTMLEGGGSASIL
jgi:ATP adenylyltransferase